MILNGINTVTFKKNVPAGNSRAQILGKQNLSSIQGELIILTAALLGFGVVVTTTQVHPVSNNIF